MIDRGQVPALVAAMFVLILLWGVLYLVVVLPVLDEASQELLALQILARALFIYMMAFILVRVICVCPRVARLTARWYEGTTVIKACCAKLIFWDGPLYMFIFTSVVIILMLIFLRDASNEAALTNTLMVYAIISGATGFVCTVLDRLMLSALWLDPAKTRAAPPDTINHLETFPYDEHIFGDDEGCQYPGECAICLSTFEAEDRIKITPCRHAFHEECIQSWLQQARTCAMCRVDLVAAAEELQVSGREPGSDDGSLSHI